ncbi:MAG: hypothetical protein ACR2P0_01320 [Acidimicrobiales bacterium]
MAEEEMSGSTSKSGSKGSDSSRKVAKAAKAGQSANAASGREQRDLGFPMAMAGVIIVGVLLVIFSWNARDVLALEPSFDDHWHLPYGIYDCQTDSFLPNLADPAVPNSGIHTHGDGVIHLHPRSSDATGNNAQLGVFLDAVRVEIEDDAILSFPDRAALDENGAECGGEPAILQVARFDPGTSTPSEVVTENLLDFRFSADQERVTIAFAPAGAEILPPPQANIDQAAAASPFVLQTDGLEGLEDLNNLDGFDPAAPNAGIGLDEDGNVVDIDGNVLIPAEQIPVPEDGE